MSFARACRLMGPAGSGQLTKMINQICIAGLVQGLAEGIHFGKRAGLDIEAVLDVISKGAAGSWQMENRGKTMNQGKFDFGFAVDWMRKDLAICLARSAQERRQAARDRPRRPVLRRRAGEGRTALGYLEPDLAVGDLSPPFHGQDRSERRSRWKSGKRPSPTMAPSRDITLRSGIATARRRRITVRTPKPACWISCATAAPT